MKDIVAENRINQGHYVDPTFGIIDSQIVKTVYSSEERGSDGEKKVKDRKRHIVVDTLRNLLHIKIHPEIGMIRKLAGLYLKRHWKNIRVCWVYLLTKAIAARLFFKLT